MKVLPGDLTAAGAATLFVAVVAVVVVVVVAAAAVAVLVVVADAADVAVAAEVVAVALAAEVVVVALAAEVVVAVFAAEVVTAAAYDVSSVVVDVDADLCYLGTPILAPAVPVCLVYLLMVMDVEMCHPNLSQIYI
jgi:hypothetical protein